jgi:hypothetical protein
MEERILQIYMRFGEYIREIIPLKDEEGHLKAVIYFHDSTNLRMDESWEEGLLLKYSYYWRTSDNQLKIGWDNSPHHKRLANYPHHKHIEHQTNLQSSDETTLEAVVKIVIAGMTPK